MKEWYTAKELAGMVGVPSTERRVRTKAEREGWISRKRPKGKGREYHISSLPQETRKLLLQGTTLAATDKTATTNMPAPAGDHDRISSMPAAERAIMQARLRVLDHIDELAANIGSRREAVMAFVSMARAGDLPGPMMETLRVANARTGGRRLISPATIYRWMEKRDAAGAQATAPRRLGRPKAPPPPWLPKLLALYQRPQKPTVSACLREWQQAYPDDPAPNLRTAQRWLNKLPVEVREWGRMGRRALRSVQPFVRRTTDGLWPMDVVTVDGHLFKAYVRHPLTGRRFRPEITTYVDIATRKVIGFSAWIAESQFAIWSALREMVLHPDCGVPAIHYSDNGAYRGEQHRAVMARIGTTMMFSEAYRAQARGAIERLNSSVWVPLAKQLDTYVGEDADQEHVKKAMKRADSTGQGLLSWEEFVAGCRRAIDDYNDRPHSSLGGKTPNEAWQGAVNEGWRPTLLDEDDLHDLLPAVERTVLRGEVRLPWGRYFHDDLSLWHRRTVQVHIQPTDGSRVWVADERGALICVAERDGNARPYVSESMLEHARARRAAGRANRLERKLEQVREEAAGVIDMPRTEISERYIEDTRRQFSETDLSGIHAITDERKLHALWTHVAGWIEAGESLPEDIMDANARYWRSPLSASMASTFEAFGLTPDRFLGEQEARALIEEAKKNPGMTLGEATNA